MYTTLLPNEADFKFISQQIQSYLNPYKIASKEEIDNAILTDAKDLAYLKILPVGQISDHSGPLKTSSLIFMQYVINAENGEYLAYVNPSPIQVPGVLGLLVNNNKLKKNDLQSIVMAIESGPIEK